MDDIDFCGCCCHEKHITREDGLCAECGRWDDYWKGLTPAEREEELKMMDFHAAEQDAEIQRERDFNN